MRLWDDIAMWVEIWKFRLRKLIGGRCEVCSAVWPHHRPDCWRNL